MINVAHVQPPEVNRPHCSIRSTSFNVKGTGSTTSLDEEVKVDASGMEVSIKLSLSSTDAETDDSASLSIAVIGATGLLARTKIFPALFALYYSGHLPEVGTLDQLPFCSFLTSMHLLIFLSCSVSIIFMSDLSGA